MKRNAEMLAAVILVLFFCHVPCPGAVFALEKGKGDAGIFVERVNDGDTISAIVGGHFEKIRLIGIDAPEMGQEPWGEIARRRLREMMVSSSWEVSIECDVERRDKYGRLLAYLRTKDGRMVNSEMVREGYAVLLTIPPNVKYVNIFVAAEKYAREKKAGIWSRNGLKIRPADYRREHPLFR